MAFVDNYLSVAFERGRKICVIHANKRLHDGNVKPSVRLPRASADPSDVLLRNPEELRKTFRPLGLELIPVHQHEGGDFPLRNQPGRQHRFPERPPRGQHACLVLREFLCGQALHVGIHGIHERCKPYEASAQTWRQLRLSNVDGVGERYLHLIRKMAIRKFVARALPYRRSEHFHARIEERPQFVAQCFFLALRKERAMRGHRTCA